MDIEDFVDIKSKKQLLGYLNDNKIEYKKHQRRIEFSINFFVVTYTVRVQVNKDQITTISFSSSNYQDDYTGIQNEIYLLKRQFDQSFGLPIYDTTYSLAKYKICIEYKKENSIIAIYANEENAAYHLKNGLVIVVTNKDIEETVNKSNSFAPVFIIGIVIGIFWGLCMFFSCSDTHSLQDFGIWMIGGQIFGLFTSIPLFFSNKKPKKEKIGKRTRNKLESLGNDNSYLGHLYHIIANGHNAKSKRTPAVFIINEKDVSILYFKHKKIEKISSPIEKMSSHLPFNEIVIKSNNNMYNTFRIIDEEKSKIAIKELESKIYDFDKLNELFELLKTKTIECNPCGVFNSLSKDYYDNSIMIAAKILLIKGNISQLDLFRAFNADDHLVAILRPIYNEIFD